MRGLLQTMFLCWICTRKILLNIPQRQLGVRTVNIVICSMRGTKITHPPSKYGAQARSPLSSSSSVAGLSKISLAGMIPAMQIPHRIHQWQHPAKKTTQLNTVGARHSLVRATEQTKHCPTFVQRNRNGVSTPPSGK